MAKKRTAGPIIMHPKGPETPLNPGGNCQVSCSGNRPTEQGFDLDDAQAFIYHNGILSGPIPAEPDTSSTTPISVTSGSTTWGPINIDLNKTPAATGDVFLFVVWFHFSHVILPFLNHWTSYASIFVLNADCNNNNMSSKKLRKTKSRK
jgi:hypothetical protein